MPEYLTPGVYYEKVDSGARPIAPLRTDVTGFVGIARRGPLHRAIPIDSWRQFEAWFGDVIGAGYLAYAVRGFFECGGRRLWIVRVSSPNASTASLTITTATPSPGWLISASSPGVWGNDLDVRLVETHRTQTRSHPTASTAGVFDCRFRRGLCPRHATSACRPAPRRFSIELYRSPIQTRSGCTGSIPIRASAVHGNSRSARPIRTRSLVIESVEYTLLVRAEARLVARYEDLSLVPDHPRYATSDRPRAAAPPRGRAGLGRAAGAAARGDCRTAPGR